MSRINKVRFWNGVTVRNAVLMSGVLIAPVAGGAADLTSACVLSLGYALVTVPAVLISAYIPRRLAYSVRVIVYALAAAVVFIPVFFIILKLFGEAGAARAGVYLPIAVCNPLILSKTESRYAADKHVPPSDIAAETGGLIFGFAAVCLVTGAVRDLLTGSTLGGLSFNLPPAFPAAEKTFFGFIILGVFAAVLRKILK